MSIRLYTEPDIKNPHMFCGWPGIGNVGLLAVDTLRAALKAEEFGEIEPYEFFNPTKVIIQQGLLKDLQFPSNRFYYGRTKDRDVIFFIGQQQPTEGATRYAEGHKAYQMANLVLDVAEKFGAQRLYTSGAAVTQIHHTLKPHVWAVPNSTDLISEIEGYENIVLMGQTDRRGGYGAITGLNGLLLGVAKDRGIPGFCLMGEVPYYLQGAPWPYPKASKAVLETLGAILGIELDFDQLDALANTVEKSIEQFLETLFSAEGVPPQVKDEIEKLKHVRQAGLGPITKDEQKRIMEHIDELFRPDDRDKKRHV